MADIDIATAPGVVERFADQNNGTAARIVQLSPGTTVGAVVTDGQASTGGVLAATTSAQALGASLACHGVLVQNDPNNTVDVLVGNAAAQPMRLTPGQSIAVPTLNVNLIFAKTASGTGSVNWLPVV